MIGSLRWNVIFGLIGLALSFLMSISHNMFSTSIIRGLYGFIIMFLFCFFFRWVLGTLVGMKTMTPQLESALEEGNPNRGTNVDVVTPSEQESLSQLLKDNMQPADAGSFSPLNPPKLSSMPPEEMAKVVRHLSDNEGG